jgi:ABC-type Fe3+ transport system substrate-binding protein
VFCTGKKPLIYGLQKTRAKRQRGASVSQSKAEEIVVRLLSNAAGLQYGSVSVMLNVHSGRITNVIYSITENTRDAETKEDAKPQCS